MEALIVDDRNDAVPGGMWRACPRLGVRANTNRSGIFSNKRTAPFVCLGGNELVVDLGAAI
jgi:hypothetical protein